MQVLNRRGFGKNSKAHTMSSWRTAGKSDSTAHARARKKVLGLRCLRAGERCGDGTDRTRRAARGRGDRACEWRCQVGCRNRRTESHDTCGVRFAYLCDYLRHALTADALGG